MTTRQEQIAYWYGHEAAFGRHEQESQALPRQEDCAHDWQVTGYAWPPGGRAFPDDPPEYVRLQCSKCEADVEERWT